jgi:hypothetical protein
MEIKWKINEGDRDPALRGSTARVANVVLFTRPLAGEWRADILIDTEPVEAATREDAQASVEAKLRELVETFVATARAEGAMEAFEACVEIAATDADASRAEAERLTETGDKIERNFWLGRSLAASKIELAIRARRDGAT